MKNKYKIYENFHGLTDFYNLIKTSMKLLLKKKEENEFLNIDEAIKQEIGIISIERNFGGLEFGYNEGTSIELILNLFTKRFTTFGIITQYNVFEKIFDNIKDNESRYLLLIIKSSIFKYLLLSNLTSTEFKKISNKDLSLYMGSLFEQDKNSEEYFIKLLTDIKFQIEKNKIILLSDIDSVYPSLNELFKQNFVKVGGKKYLTIPNYYRKELSLVDNNFKCIVMIDKDKLDTFSINSFEKHLIDKEALIEKELLEKAEKVSNMFVLKEKPQENKLNSNLFIDGIEKCIMVILLNIISNRFSKNQKEEQKVTVQYLLDLTLEKFANILSQDIMIILKYLGFWEEKPEISNKIIDFYKKGEHSNLFNFLKKMANIKNIIYTFTSIDEPLLVNIPQEFTIELIGKISNNNIKEIKISSFIKENDIEEQLNTIYSNEETNIKIIILKFDSEKCEEIMQYFAFFIDNYIKKNNFIEEQNKKVFIFSVHIKRNFINEKNGIDEEEYSIKEILSNSISYLFDFYQIFIDNLNGDDISIIDIINLKEEQLDIDIDNNNQNFAPFIEEKNDINNFLINNYSKKVFLF